MSVSMQIRDYDGKTKPPKMIKAPISRDGRTSISVFVGLSRSVPIAGSDEGNSKEDANWVEGDWFFGTAGSERYSDPNAWDDKEIELIYRQHNKRYKLEWQHDKFNKFDNLSLNLDHVREIFLKRKTAAVIPVVAPVVYGVCHRCFVGPTQFAVNMGRCTVCGGMLQRI